eukprot:752406-Hanusia_phi.AAC.1
MSEAHGGGNCLWAEQGMRKSFLSSFSVTFLNGMLKLFVSHCNRSIGNELPAPADGSNLWLIRCISIVAAHDSLLQAVIEFSRHLLVERTFELDCAQQTVLTCLMVCTFSLQHSGAGGLASQSAPGESSLPRLKSKEHLESKQSSWVSDVLLSLLNKGMRGRKKALEMCLTYLQVAACEFLLIHVVRDDGDGSGETPLLTHRFRHQNQHQIVFVSSFIFRLFRWITQRYDFYGREFDDYRKDVDFLSTTPPLSSLALETQIQLVHFLQLELSTPEDEGQHVARQNYLQARFSQAMSTEFDNHAGKFFMAVLKTLTLGQQADGRGRNDVVVAVVSFLDEFEVKELKVETFLLEYFDSLRRTIQSGRELREEIEKILNTCNLFPSKLIFSSLNKETSTSYNRLQRMLEAFQVVFEGEGSDVSKDETYPLSLAKFVLRGLKQYKQNMATHAWEPISNFLLRLLLFRYNSLRYEIQQSLQTQMPVVLFTCVADLFSSDGGAPKDISMLKQLLEERRARQLFVKMLLNRALLCRGTENLCADMQHRFLPCEFVKLVKRSEGGTKSAIAMALIEAAGGGEMVLEQVEMAKLDCCRCEHGGASFAATLLIESVAIMPDQSWLDVASVCLQDRQRALRLFLLTVLCNVTSRRVEEEHGKGKGGEGRKSKIRRAGRKTLRTRK